MFAAKKEHSQHSQSPKLENPAGDDSPVGSFEEEHPETSVHISIPYLKEILSSNLICN
jgi:hypothetical protein